jgi:hypothetical protein
LPEAFSFASTFEAWTDRRLLSHVKTGCGMWYCFASFAAFCSLIMLNLHIPLFFHKVHFAAGVMPELDDGQGWKEHFQA